MAHKCALLQRIAEGNPDPDRIGAFGVGFYSLFSISEEPIVLSGPELMGFFWNGDSLFTRRAKSETVDNSPSGVPWTTFHMPLREPAPFSDSFLDLSRFLATSLTFTANVRHLSLYFDDKPLCRLKKVIEPSKVLPMPSHLNATSPGRMLRIQKMDSTAMRLEVEAMKLVLDLAQKPKSSVVDLASAFTKTSGGGFAGMLQSAFGRKEPKTVPTPKTPSTPSETTADKTAHALTTISSSVHVRIATAAANVSVDRAFEREIERSTKKPPPKVTRLQVIAQNKDEADASQAKSSGVGVMEIFKGIMPTLDTQGHVFIGFKTSQTTAFAGHLAARFIPTVERESIDFIDKYCAQWNNELLAMGGYVTRAVYESEMADIGTLWNEKVGTSRPKEDNETVKWLLDRALHIMQFFTFRTSTPSPRVHAALQAAFFNCARQATLTLASTRGVKHSALVRFPNAVLADFIKDLAVIPASHVEAAGEFITQVKSRGLVREITMDDVFAELAARPLTVPEMIACLKWWISASNHPSYDPSLRRQLLDNALLEVTGKDEASPASIQQLATVSTFLNPQRVPTDVPLPASCLAYEVSKDIPAADMHRVFGWSELTVATWVSHVASLSRQKDASVETSLQMSPIFAEKVLGILARSWGSLSVQQQSAIIDTLKEMQCIPTRKGIQKPSDAYFPNVSLFEDLPIIELPSVQVKGNIEKVAAALGVRRHVELQMIFSRLIGSGDWDITQLVTYLAANKCTLSSLEIERLTKTAMFPKAGETGSLGKDGKPKIPRYRASQLYEPVDALKALGLPLMDWPGKIWRSSSEEAKFVFELGLRRHPPVDELLSLASSANTNEDIRSKALSYILERHSSVYKNTYSLKTASQFAFVPCVIGGKRMLKSPSDVFTNKDAAVMGFPIVSDELSSMDVAKFGLRSNPNSAQILSKVVNEPTQDIGQAQRIFEYLSSVPDLTPSDYKMLYTAAFIPVKKTRKSLTDLNSSGKVTSADTDTAVTLARPSESYFGDKSANSQLKEVLNDIFIFIDFGDRAAVFLRNCGVSKEPSIAEIATQLVRTPQRFYQIAGVDAYLGLLRQIASNWQQMSYNLRNEMKRSAFVLASKRLNASTKQDKASAPKNLMDDDLDEEDDADEQGVLVHDLKRPNEVVVVDDATSHMLFASVIFCAPHEDVIEAMVAELGARKLSTLVDERYEAAGRVVSDTPRCQEVNSLVLERTPLYIFEKRQTNKSEIRRDADWLKSHLQVVEVDGRGLRLTRHLRLGSLDVSNEQRCSAMASLSSSGKLLLYIAGNMDIDWFEVAFALSKHLLSRQKLPEVLLYMTLLSTSLRNLKRRGFHVDKILTQRKAEREAIERHQREERARTELEAARRPSEGQFKQWTKDVLAVFPDADPAYVEQQLRDAKTDHVVNATNKLLERPYPKTPKAKPATGLMSSDLNNGGARAIEVASKHDVTHGSEQQGLGSSKSSLAQTNGGSGLFSTWRNRLKSGQSSSSTAEPPVPGGWQPGQTKYPLDPNGGMAGPNPNGLQYAESITDSVAAGQQNKQATARNPNAGVTPTPAIRSQVLSAIQASQGGAGGAGAHIQSQASQTQVKEAQSTYCDATGMAHSLRLAGQIAGMDIYVSPELDPSTTLSNNGQGMQRYIDDIIRPLIKVFDLDPQSLHVFVDVSGPSIAFNRGGQLFLNFRYHLVWFDEEVRQHDRTNALISTYHSLAHEIAHNLVAQHDSEHEFWFSSICEHFFVRFAALITHTQEEDAQRRSAAAAPSSARFIEAS